MAGVLIRREDTWERQTGRRPCDNGRGDVTRSQGNQGLLPPPEAKRKAWHRFS